MLNCQSSRFKGCFSNRRRFQAEFVMIILGLLTFVLPK